MVIACLRINNTIAVQLQDKPSMCGKQILLSTKRQCQGVPKRSTHTRFLHITHHAVYFYVVFSKKFSLLHMTVSHSLEEKMTSYA